MNLNTSEIQVTESLSQEVKSGQTGRDPATGAEEQRLAVYCQQSPNKAFNTFTIDPVLK